MHVSDYTYINACRVRKIYLCFPKPDHQDQLTMSAFDGLRCLNLYAAYCYISSVALLTPVTIGFRGMMHNSTSGKKDIIRTKLYQFFNKFRFKLDTQTYLKNYGFFGHYI